MSPLNKTPLSWEEIKQSHQESSVGFFTMCFEYLANNISSILNKSINLIWNKIFNNEEKTSFPSSPSSMEQKRFSIVDLEEERTEVLPVFKEEIEESEIFIPPEEKIGKSEVLISPKEEIKELEASPVSEEETKEPEIFMLAEEKTEKSEVFISPKEDAKIPQTFFTPEKRLTDGELKKQYVLSTRAAAAKGCALQAAIRGITQKTAKKEALENSGVSKQEVFILRSDKVVYKKGGERAKEEENLVNDLFDLASEDAIVGSHQIHKPGLHTFCIPFPKEIRERGFSRNDLRQEEYQACLSKLSAKEVAFLHEEEVGLSPEARELYKNYHAKFAYQLGERIITSSLKHIRYLFATGQLPEDTRIIKENEGGGSLTLGEHITLQTPFYFLLTTPLSPPSYYFSPSFTSNLEKQQYADCEQFMWSFRDAAGELKVVDWKKLHFLFFTGHVINHIEQIEREGREVLSEETKMGALNIDWNVTGSALMESKVNGTQEKRLEEVQAKPLRVNMFSLFELRKFASARNAIMKKLTENTKFDAIMTAQFQLLDLHSGNLGVSPIPNEEYEFYQDVSFHVAGTGSAMSLKRLLVRYLNGEISQETKIQFAKEFINQYGIKKVMFVNRPLEKIPELLKALDVSWKFDIFDTDISLGESNELEIINNEKHIPIRSALLEVAFKDEPLSGEVVGRLMDHEERDARIKHWSQRLDAPIYQSLRPSTKERVRELLEPLFVATYSLNQYKKLGKGNTIKKMRQDFVNNISKIPFDSSALPIWELIEQDVKGVMENSSKAESKRRKIAAQLFPRISVGQQKALFERQERQNKYLTNYHNLVNSREVGEVLLQQIKSFIEQSETPLNSLKKEMFQESIFKEKEEMLRDPSKLEELRKEICSQTEPTYFNLTAAMYPLLGDVYTLYKRIYPNKSIQEIGEMIGCHNAPMMTRIEQAIKDSSDPDTQILGRKLGMQINSVQNPHIMF